MYARVPADGTVGLIYCEVCCPTVAPGEPPLIVCLRPLPGYGAEHNGVFSGAIVVSVWQHPEYPLSPKEVEWSIAHDCGCEDHEWSDLSVCWEKVNDIADDDLQELLAQYEANSDTNQGELAPGSNGQSDSLPAQESQGTGQGEKHAAKKPKRKRKTDPSRRGSGEPRTIPSIYLMDMMRPLDDVYNFQHLFPGYCHVYEDSQGHLPENPRASFDAAAYSCAERIIRERHQQ